VIDVRRLEGGVSSLTYAAVLSTPSTSLPVVLKFAPPGLAPLRNRDVLRQALVLERLAGLDGFPVPAVLAQDRGDPPDVPPMFVMELLPGDAYEPMLDISDEPPTGEDVRDRIHAAARALARLQSRDPVELGIREPSTSVAAELDRWRDLFATVDQDIAPGHADLYARLAERLPDDAPPVLVHGDYRAANMLFVGPRLTAVDLSWLLLHTDPPHTFHARRPAADVAAGRLMPSAGSVLDTYVDERRRLGASPDHLAPVLSDHEWFMAWAAYKVASTISVIHKRDRKRPDPDPKIAVAASRLDEVLRAGHHALDSRPRVSST
jgi:aminoglycoside phosphotransferase (APT) family kinase protein